MKNQKGILSMIIKEFVQKYLAVKEMFEKCKITGERYYGVDNRAVL